MPKTKKKKSVKSTSVNHAEQQAARQRDISVSEFFAKNRHLLGFDNPRRALLTVIKEAVDNSLDACEESGILPEIMVEIKELENDRYYIAVEDNGPGIVKTQIPKIFAKLLYGSKFHSLKMSRGQQGIGISAAAMYGQLTTGKPVFIKSKISKNKPAHSYTLHINLQKNQPEILKDEEMEWDKEKGTKLELEIEAKYTKGKQSVDEYLRLTAIANPHMKMIYRLQLKNQTLQKDENNDVIYDRVVKEMPKMPKSIKPHPYGIELGILMRMLKETKGRSVRSFLTSEFSRISPKTADEICKIADIKPTMRPVSAGRHHTENIFNAIQKVKIMNPSTDCISPIGEENILAGLKRETAAPFYTAVTRPPSVYRGNPFQVEAGIAYGGDNLPGDELAQVMRFANRVPLLYQQSGCAGFKAVLGTSWRNYCLQQSKGALPTAPMIVFIHIASVWVPFTSESKEAIAHYPEIIKEMKLALQEVGRKLATFLRKKKKAADEMKKRMYIEKYIPQIGIALKEILDLTDRQEKKTVDNLKDILERSRKM